MREADKGDTRAAPSGVDEGASRMIKDCTRSVERCRNMQGIEGKDKKLVCDAAENGGVSEGFKGEGEMTILASKESDGSACVSADLEGAIGVSGKPEKNNYIAINNYLSFRDMTLDLQQCNEQ